MRTSLWVVMVVTVVLVSARWALGVEPTTQPAESPLQKILSTADEAKTWAKWACILSGLAVLGVLWIGSSMRTLARNQVQLARMIQAMRQA